MTQLNKFEDLYGRFSSLGTSMTQPNKFSYLNSRFASLWTEMTHPNKFRDFTLLLFRSCWFSFEVFCQLYGCLVMLGITWLFVWSS